MPIKSQAQRNAYDAAIAKYNERAQTSMNNYKTAKGGEQTQGSRAVAETAGDEQGLRKLNELKKSIRFNHDIGNEKCKVIVNPDKERKNYGTGATQLTLPHRFGMYKTPMKDVPKITKTELEDPMSKIGDMSSILERNPDHKVRGIFI